MQRKIKIQFCQKFWKFWQKKTLFGFVFCPGQISVTIKDRETGIFFVVLAKIFSLCNVRVKYAKCQILVDFEQFLQFCLKNGLISYIIAHAIFFAKSSGVSAKEVRNVNNTGVLYT